MNVKQKKIETAKREILDAAGRVLLERGYRDVTMENIAKEVGLAPGTLYYYFESKEEIFRSIDSEVMDGVLAIMDNVEDMHGPFERIVSAMLRRILDVFRENKPYSMFVMNTIPFVKPETLSDFKERRRKVYRKMQDRFLKVINAAKKKGELRDVKPRHLNFVLGGIVHEIIFSLLMGEAREDQIEGDLDSLVDIIFNGIAVRNLSRQAPKEVRDAND